jgi:hypothetical protein
MPEEEEKKKRKNKHKKVIHRYENIPYMVQHI